jgi:hypothetical protein
LRRREAIALLGGLSVIAATRAAEGFEPLREFMRSVTAKDYLGAVTLVARNGRTIEHQA